jgi:hypothetical protein
MNKRIIYKTDSSVTILTPSPECLQRHTIKEIAEKDVPKGMPYKIVNVSEIPSDRTFRNAWEIDDAELTDGVGAESNEFLEIR